MNDIFGVANALAEKDKRIAELEALWKAECASTDRLAARELGLEHQLAALREAVSMAMESHTVDGYVNWDKVAALLQESSDE